LSIRERLRPVFSMALELGPEVEVDQLRQRGHERWDSLGHLALIAAIEEEFDVELDADQLLEMTSFERAKQILLDLGVEDRS
jgi:acyl carrier protein